MDLPTRLSHVAQLIMGLVYLVSGLVKVWEPVLFYWDVAPYAQLLGVSSWQRLAGAALLLAPLEVVLGAALLATWRPRAVLPAGVVLMVLFVGLMVSAWRAGATDECGCFGVLVERGPGAAALEDAVMLALLLFAWRGMRRQASGPWAGRIVAVAAVLAFALGGVRLSGQTSRLTASDLQPGVRLTGLSPQGLDVDLMHGEFLVELMSPRCGHCAVSVPRLNAYVQHPGLPRVVALSAFPQGAPPLAQFRAQAQPLFSIGTISRTDFFRLTYGHGFPRLALVRDGVVQRVWERDEFPTPAQVSQLASRG